MKWLVAILILSVILIAGCSQQTQNIIGNYTKTYVNTSETHTGCESHSDCLAMPYATENGPAVWDIFCDNGHCRTPLNYTEWETACNNQSRYKNQCFEITVSVIKYEVGTEAAFDICNKNYENSDEAENCKLRVVCGYNAASPETQPGDESCIQQAISSNCSDGRKNGRESDIDCGQFECKPCENGKPCRSNIACKSGVCNLNGVENRDICIPICPDGPIKDNAPCGCQAQGYEKSLVEDWERQYGNGKTLFCCNGTVKQLLPNQKCI